MIYHVNDIKKYLQEQLALRFRLSVLYKSFELDKSLKIMRKREHEAACLKCGNSSVLFRQETFTFQKAHVLVLCRKAEAFLMHPRRKMCNFFFKERLKFKKAQVKIPGPNSQRLLRRFQSILQDSAAQLNEACNPKPGENIILVKHTMFKPNLTYSKHSKFYWNKLQMD